jgi:hypothetical protein
MLTYAARLQIGAGQRVNVVLLTKNKNVKCTRQANAYTTAEGVSWKVCCFEACADVC